jgi:hypothetical protein
MSPTIDDLLVDVQDPAGKTQRQIITEPRFQVVRRALRGRSKTPLRISPQVRTLKNKSSSSVASIHVVTFGFAFGLMSSEMTFVSSKNPLTAQRPAIIRFSLEIDRDLRQWGLGKEFG